MPALLQPFRWHRGQAPSAATPPRLRLAALRGPRIEMPTSRHKRLTNDTQSRETSHLPPPQHRARHHPRPSGKRWSEQSEVSADRIGTYAGEDMNSTYKSIWNESLGAWVATSELCKARGKRSSSSVLAAGLLIAVVCGGASSAWATDECGVVASGGTVTCQGDGTPVGDANPNTPALHTTPTTSRSSWTAQARH